MSVECYRTSPSASSARSACLITCRNLSSNFSINMKTWCGVCVVAAWWCVAAAGNCNITMEGRNYMEETLISNVDWSTGLAFDYSTDNLFFTFENGSWNNVKLDLKGNDLSVIEELRGPCAFTVDQEHGRVRAGCSTYDRGIGGLHEWNINTGRFQLAGEAGENVAFVHYHNDTLYYSAYRKLLLHIFTRGLSARVSAPESQVRRLVVNAQGHYIFTNNTGVYRWWGDGQEVRYVEFGGSVWTLAVGDRGAAYACNSYNPRGIWRLHESATSATMLLDVKCTGLTFDGDGNIIYANPARDSIVRLVGC